MNPSDLGPPRAIGDTLDADDGEAASWLVAVPEPSEIGSTLDADDVWFQGSGDAAPTETGPELDADAQQPLETQPSPAPRDIGPPLSAEAPTQGEARRKALPHG